MPSKKPRANKLTAAAAKVLVQNRINSGMKALLPNLHGQYTGYHRSKIYKRGATKYRGAKGRQTQFNMHLSTILKHWYSSFSGQSEIEIQVAHVNDRYFIASNRNDTVDKIHQKLISKAT